MTSNATPNQSVRTASIQWEDLPLADFDKQVLQERGLTPGIAHARGYESWTRQDAIDNGFTGMHARDTLAIPVFNLAGEPDDFLLRPHDPPIDKETGKPRKYMWRPGHTPALGGPPAGTPEAERRAHELRDDLRVPIVITESVLKSDTFLVHSDRPVYTMAIHGTWNWVKNGATMPELRDVPWRKKQNNRITYRRPVLLLPDSDYLFKPEVAHAWWSLGDALRRKGGDVWICHLPTAPDGSKLGPDDAIARGIVSTTQMFDSAVQLPKELPDAARRETPGETETDKDLYIATLEAEIKKRDELISGQARLIQNPFLKDKERALSFRLITMAASKASHGDIDSDGMVRLSAAELANDFRPKPNKGESIADTNQDGSYPIARRDTVKNTLRALSGLGGVPVGLTPVTRELSSGDRYVDTDITVRVEDVANPTAAIVSLADFKREKVRKPYTRQEPCPECGEIHTRTRTTTTTCDGCGSVLNEKTETINLPVANLPVDELTDEQREDLDYSVTASGKNQEGNNEGDSEPITNCPEKIRRHNSDGNLGSGIIQEAPSDRILTYQPPREYKPGECVERHCTEPALPGSHYCAGHSDIPQSRRCSHKRMTANGWEHCANPTATGHMYCDDHLLEQQEVAS